MIIYYRMFPIQLMALSIQLTVCCGQRPNSMQIQSQSLLVQHVPWVPLVQRMPWVPLVRRVPWVPCQCRLGHRLLCYDHLRGYNCQVGFAARARPRHTYQLPIPSSLLVRSPQNNIIMQPKLPLCSITAGPLGLIPFISQLTMQLTRLFDRTGPLYELSLSGPRRYYRTTPDENFTYVQSCRI